MKQTAWTLHIKHNGLINLFYCFQITYQLCFSDYVVEQKGTRTRESKESYCSLPVMVVISLILACRWTCTQVIELSINISYRSGLFHRDTQHEYSSVPQHASPQHFRSLAKHKHKNTQTLGHRPHICDSHFISFKFLPFFLLNFITILFSKFLNLTTYIKSAAFIHVTSKCGRKYRNKFRKKVAKM